MSSSRLATRGRRTSVLLLLLMVASLTVVAGTNANPASAYVGESGIKRLPKQLIGFPRKLVTVRGELIAGAFLGGYELGYHVVGPMLFGEWGPDGGSRTQLHAGFLLPGFRWLDGTTTNPPPAPGQISEAGILDLENASGASRTLRLHWQCFSVASGIVSSSSAGAAMATGPGVTYTRLNGSSKISCGGLALHTIRVVDVNSGEDVYRWVYDVPAGATAPWSVTTVTTCRAAGGLTSTITSTATTLTPAPDGAFSLDPGDCPAILPDSHVEKVVISGGRGSGETDPFLEVPLTTPEAETSYPLCTTEATGAGCQIDPRVDGESCLGSLTLECGGFPARSGASCWWGPYTVPLSFCTDAYPELLEPSTLPPVDPGTDPGPPAPGTAAPGTSVTNPDGSVTVTQVQTLPNGTTRTVTTVTWPDGSRTVTTQPTNPDGSPNGAPTVVQLPGTRPADEASSMEDGCSFGLKPWLWPFRALKCAFIPSEGTYAKVGELKDAFVTHPPGSVLVGGGQLVGGLATELSASSCGGVGPDFSPEGFEGTMQLPSWCNGSGFGGIDLLYAFVTVCLYAATMWSLWHLAESHFGVGMEA